MIALRATLKPYTSLMTSPRMYANGNRKNPPSVTIGPSATPFDAPMLERISTTAMTASMMPKYGEPIEANFGAAEAGKVLAEVIGVPFIVVRSGARFPGTTGGNPAVLALDRPAGLTAGTAPILSPGQQAVPGRRSLTTTAGRPLRGPKSSSQPP